MKEPEAGGALQFAYMQAVRKRKGSHAAEAEMLELYGWEDQGVQGETIRWWYHETMGSNPQEDAVRMTLHFYRRDVLKAPRCCYCKARAPEMERPSPGVDVVRCIDATGCKRRVSANS
jgi:hypothetical protein